MAFLYDLCVRFFIFFLAYFITSQNSVLRVRRKRLFGRRNFFPRIQQHKNGTIPSQPHFCVFTEKVFGIAHRDMRLLETRL